MERYQQLSNAMKKIIVLKALVILNIIIGIKFLVEYLSQLNYTFNADGLRLIVFVWPFSLICIVLCFYLVKINEKFYAFLSFLNGIIYFLGVMGKPKHIPSNFLVISGVSLIILLFSLRKELKKQQ
ncbi:hypothetical protein [Flavobacterium praedii]|uniref:hypothetical protein n=1 Tax=Flavobacterium praedii TaxID=3002900 RepID=UPI002481EBB0|nr:hypothetical protein [Flavobacterium praedii]